ncbi:MAG: adenosylcobalamin-dependent ribonucleoside-diphosphate reductase, partial [Planctomycetota bacterium]|nr:adenosylcobalamin-dependent ribonucleoside-diphosphate reductase [Planctomycetota bacterium]
QQGGGVGYDFSTLRPRGSRARSTGQVASGAVSFLDVWDRMCATILSTGVRRGAMMATLRCDHPDVEDFVDVKRDATRLRHFNLSVLVTDAFMEAVRGDAEWPLVFPADHLDPSGGEIVVRAWPGEAAPVECRVLGRLRARDLWERILRATYDCAEPGVLFVDRINRLNNLWYREDIGATNPCGEIPLPPYGACNLGAVNLVPFVEEPFSPEARLDLDGLRETVRAATRLLDDVVDVSRFPLEEQGRQARGTRRLGLGLTGLADALILLGHHYGTESARRVAAEAMRAICHAAYRASVDLAREKGPFPFFARDEYLEGSFVRSLPEDIQEAIAEHGVRNSHLTAVAPAGTISLLAGNVSSGVEPVFDFDYTRRVREADGSYATYDLSDHAVRLWRDRHGDHTPLPDSFVDARRLPPEAHLEMEAALQPFVDNAISKTINVPEDCDFEAFRSLYDLAYEKGLKGCTTFRPNPVTGSILASDAREFEARAPCCER